MFIKAIETGTRAHDESIIPILSLPISNLPCRLSRNITSHSIKNLAFHSVLRWIDYTTNSHYLTYTFLLKGDGRVVLFEHGSESLKQNIDQTSVFLLLFQRYLSAAWIHQVATVNYWEYLECIRSFSPVHMRR